MQGVPEPARMRVFTVFGEDTDLRGLSVEVRVLAGDVFMGQRLEPEERPGTPVRVIGMGQTLGAGEPRHRGVVLRRPPELNITPGMVFREVDGTG
jgi:hypothetical protein